MFSITEYQTLMSLSPFAPFRASAGPRGRRSSVAGRAPALGFPSPERVDSYTNEWNTRV